MLKMCEYFLRSFHFKNVKGGQSYLGNISHQPSLTLLRVILSDLGFFDSVVPSCCSSWPTGRSLFQKPSLMLLFLYFLAFKKSHKCQYLK